jgi:hypothetical protein
LRQKIQEETCGTKEDVFKRLVPTSTLQIKYSFVLWKVSSFLTQAIGCALISYLDPLGLEKIMDAANEFQKKALQARQDKKEAQRALADRKQSKRANARQKKALRYESRKIRLLEMEARIKMKRTEWDEVCERFAFVRELKALGHTAEEIEKVLGKQFNQPEGSSQPVAVSSDESDGSFSSSDHSSEEEDKS